MPSCVVKQCSNYDKNCSKKDGISFHRFPNDPIRRKVWCEILRLERNDPAFNPTTNARICSDHFSKACFRITPCGLKKLINKAVPRLMVKPSSNQPAKELGVNVKKIEASFETHLVNKLRKKLKKYQEHYKKYKSQVNCLSRQNKRLQNKNMYLKNVLKALKARTSQSLQDDRERDPLANL